MSTDVTVRSETIDENPQPETRLTGAEFGRLREEV